MIYRKRGQVVRWENGRIIRVLEQGTAVEEEDFFECFPEPGGASPDRWPDVSAVAGALHEVECERVILVRGNAEHECETRTWSDETDRIHVSIVRGSARALVDCTFASAGVVRQVAAAMKRMGKERAAPRHLRLAPNVSAALLPALIGVSLPNATLLQTAGGVDGYGRPIVEVSRDWPNFYRPSYRLRPVRLPLNLRLECDATEIDPHLPRAVALLGPVEREALRVLIEDGTSVYPAVVRVTGIEAVGSERTWYPYGGGSFGAEMML